MPSLTRDIAEYAASRMAIPAAVADIVKAGFIDCAACIVAGRGEDAVASLRRFLDEQGRTGRHRVLALADAALRAPADAALLDATAAHVLDYDDVAMAGHPSAVLVPAILAAAQALPGCSGADALHAYVVGYEVWAELYRRDEDALHQKGWHPSSTLGLVAATAAVSNLAGLPVQLARHALGIACSRASGITANFGSSTKPLHIGFAASEAILAVELARVGITAAEDALEHGSGLLKALSPSGRVDLDGAVGLSDGSRYLSMYGLSLKRYPVCYALHRILDGILGLRSRPGFDPRQVDAIELRIGDTQANMLRVEAPATAAQAKFALRFCTAVAAVQGRLGTAQLDPALMRHPEVARLLGRIRIDVDEAKCDIYPWFAPADAVTVRLQAGDVLESGPIRFARGNAHNPAGPDELMEKYRDCMAGQDALDGESLHAQLAQLQAVPDVGRMLQGCVRTRPLGARA